MNNLIKENLNDEFKTVSHFIEIFDTKELKRYEIERKLKKDNNLDFYHKSEYKLCIDQLNVKYNKKRYYQTII